MIKDEYAFIEFANLRSAEEALDELNGYNLKGGRLLVEESKPRNKDSSRKGGRESSGGSSSV